MRQMNENNKEKEKDVRYMAELQFCPQRFGRLYENRIVMTCGRRVVTADECITCIIHNKENC